MDDRLFSWNEEKNRMLKKYRDISFEAVVVAIEAGDIVDIIPNPSSNHGNQSCFVLEIRAYIYLVPFVENEDKIFLKTIYPSRKHKKIYLDKRGKQ